MLAAAVIVLLALPWLASQPASDLPSGLPASDLPAAAIRARTPSSSATGQPAAGQPAARGAATEEPATEESPTETQSEELRLRVVKVTDADTFTGEPLDSARNRDSARSAVKIRVVEIDAPEKRQPGGLGARQFAEAQLFGHVVRVEATGADRYGRTLGRVTLPDGTDYGEKLVRFGWAWRYDKYSDSERLAALQAEARAKRRGLWKQSDPIPPWEWRKRKR
jgi:endonuclease YncB( thermonuclease family)